MVELLLLAEERQVERLSDALVMELGAQSVSVEDADAGTPAEQALFGEPGLPAPQEGWQRSRLAALFADEAQARKAATLLLAQDWAQGVHVHAIRALREQDWVRLTQSQFAPLEIAPGFWIVPSWHAVPAAATRVLRLDPGLAFGTGTHPTTRMCLRWIADHAEALRGRRVLDYGCGSGILAIGAALFGAGAVDAVDIDDAAIAATRDNARANGVAARIAAVRPERPGALIAGYAVVLANILAAPLGLLAPLLSAQLAPGGWLVLAGILERQADELRAAYAPLELEIADREDGWILMSATRRAR